MLGMESNVDLAREEQNLLPLQDVTFTTCCGLAQQTKGLHVNVRFPNLSSFLLSYAHLKLVNYLN